MFGPDYTAGCPTCSSIADGFNGSVVQVANHDVTLCAVSRAPLVKLQAYKQRMGWSFPWASSFGSDFNYDFQASHTKQEWESGAVEWNFRHNDLRPPAGQESSWNAWTRVGRRNGLGNLPARRTRHERVRAPERRPCVPPLCTVGVVSSEGRTDRGHLRAGGVARTRGSRASFVLARTGSSRVLAASLGIAVVLSVAITTALAGFGARTLPEAVHQRLARTPGTSVAINGQIGAARASADSRVIDSLFRSAFGGAPFTPVMGRWSDELALPQPRNSSVISTIQAAALGGVASHVELAAGSWPGPVRRGQPIGVALSVSTACMLGLSVGEVLALRDTQTAARLLDRVSARARHVDAALAGWQVSRRPQRQADPILLVVLAVATGTLALAQHQSWRQSQLDQASFAAGAGVRVDLANPLALGRGGTLAHTGGVVSAMPVARYYSGFSILALDARAAAGTVLLRPDLSALPASTLWRRIIPARCPRSRPPCSSARPVRASGTWSRCRWAP
jgi:hypothetical protein